MTESIIQGRVLLDPLRFKKTVTSNHRILAYSAIILICSIITLPDDYRVDKRNILNQWFVKLGWFWTLTSVSTLLFATTDIDDRETVSQSIFRIVTSTILWYFSVNFFQILDTATGFDISGHTFLLIFSNLIIASELRLIKTLKQNRKDRDSKPSQLERHSKTIKIALMSLSVLWDFMLVQTALFYHTLIQKAIAAVWAVASWYILHSAFYQRLTVDRGLGPR